MTSPLTPLTPRSAPTGGPVSVCPHCWYVNRFAARLCAGCAADMATLLQESGGLRRTAPVQSPVPVRSRLSPVQRLLVLGFVALYALSIVVPAWKTRISTPAVQHTPSGAPVGSP